MYVSVNKKNEIKMVGVSSDPNLTSLYINDEESPFKGWSEVKICCYKVNVKNGIVYMMTPYVDSRLIEHFDALGLADERSMEAISETNDGLIETYEATINNESMISECEDALMELYEMIIGE